MTTKSEVPVQTFSNSPEQVGRRLGVSGMTVRRWIKAGRIEAVRLGSGDASNTPYRISDEAIARFVRPARQEGNE